MSSRRSSRCIREPPILSIESIVVDKSTTKKHHSPRENSLGTAKLQKTHSMDNLKLMATFHPDMITEKSFVSIHSTTRQGYRYEVALYDLSAIQFPKPFLQFDVCQQMILDHIQEFEYKYHSDTDQIEVRYVVIGKEFGFRTLLQRVLQEVDWVAKVQDHDSRIDALEPYEILHEHVYPQWETLDEFKDLPDFKYFQALRQWHKYIQPLPESIPYTTSDNQKRKPMYITESRGFHVGFTPFHEIRPETDVQYLLQSILSPHKHRPFYSEIIDRADQIIGSTISNADKNNSTYWETFVKSVEVIRPEAYKISKFVLDYMLQYTAGWGMIHASLFAFRTSGYAELQVKGDQITLVIYRSKKTSFAHSNVKKYDNQCSPEGKHLQHPPFYIVESLPINRFTWTFDGEDVSG